MSSAVAIVTPGYSFPDGIGSTPLACGRKWPVLLTDTGANLNPYAAQALAELGITQAIRVGTYAALPQGVTGLANLSGSDRYHTNVNVTEWAVTNGGLVFTNMGVAPGDLFPDALTAGPYLGRLDGVLLLSPAAGPLPSCIAAEIAANGSVVRRVTFFGMHDSAITAVITVLGY
ncbi:MAG: cell wall-binding repeat-containing protein [Thermoleophilia bacterium]|nr:cell wall-binding repeat-containing protein [Thermoleophilia bacterium]